MKIYIAANYRNKYSAQRIAVKMRMLGHEVIARWIHCEYPHVENGPTSAPLELRGVLAANNVEDVRNCDLLIALACGERSRGGKHVELGIALALEKHVIISGEPENIFHFHPGVIRCGSYDDDICNAVNEVNAYNK